MSKDRIQYCIANWKMCVNNSDGISFVNQFKQINHTSHAKVIICPSYTLLDSVSKNFQNTRFSCGAQDVYFEETGAFTGKISVSMLTDIGVEYCILGHSERRHVFGETNQVIHQKINAIMNSSIIPILCIGETQEERESENTKKVLEEQLVSAFLNLDLPQEQKIIIAYEPVWAIGTGKVATPEMVSETHLLVRNIINDIGFNANKISILYGGSVKPENASQLADIENVDGFLIGGASLNVDSFSKILDKL
jgi:triosephosphate isomerase